MTSTNMTSILLPAARIDIYAQDESTAALAQKLTADWRFARVTLRVVREDIDAAVAYYAQNASPDLMIVETADISDAFVARLGALAGVCSEGTDAVVVGPTNDVRLYRSLIGMGVKDYLVRPLSEDDVVSTIAKALIEKKGLSGAQLVAVVGGKGGVGVTAVSQVLAWLAAERLGQKTLLMDLAGSNGTLGVSFGLEPTTSFSEAVRIGASGSEDDVKRIVQAVSDNLSVLVCGGEPILNARPDPDSVEALVTRLMQKHPVVIIDLSGASRAVQKRILSLAAQVVLVTTPIVSALRNTRTYMGEIKSVRTSLKDISLVVNMQGLAGAEDVALKDIQAALDMAPAARLPFSPKIFIASESAGRAVGLDKAAAPLLAALEPLAARAVGVEAGAGQKTERGSDAFSFFKKKSDR